MKDKKIQNTKYKKPYTLIPLYRFSVDCRLQKDER
jgi:hypothetical protein